MAPSTASTLHPIVIPPTHVPPHFTTIGNGLLHGSHARESVAALRTMVISDYSFSKPKPWWRAQCLLYGLDAPEKRTIEELRNMLGLALLTNGLQVPRALLALEQAENGKFRKLNAQVRDATSVGSNNRPKPAPKKVGPLKHPKPARNDPLKAVKSATKVTKSVPSKAVKSPAKPAPKRAAPSSTDVTVRVTVKVQAAKAAPVKKQPAKKTPQRRK